MSIDKLKQAAGGGSRPNQFKVYLSFPTGVNVNLEKANILVEAAALPGVSINNIELEYAGKTGNFAGKKVYEPWTATMVVSNDHEVRKALITWSNLITSHENAIGAVDTADYQVDIVIHQLNLAGDVVEECTLRNAWPSSIEALTLSQLSSSEISKSNVTFTYDYWVSPETS